MWNQKQRSDTQKAIFEPNKSVFEGYNSVNDLKIDMAYFFLIFNILTKTEVITEEKMSTWSP